MKASSHFIFHCYN